MARKISRCCNTARKNR